MKIHSCVLLLAAVALLGPAALEAQQAFNPRDDQFRTLGLVRTRAELDRAQTRYERASRLHETDVISAQELEDYRVAFERARVDYLQQSLSLSSASAHVTVERAVRRRTIDGQSEVRVTLRNTTSGGEIVDLGDLLSAEEVSRLNPSVINNVHVSLKTEPGAAGTIVSQPYERRIASLDTNQLVTVDFRLLQELEELVVSVNFGDRIVERRVFLELDASSETVEVQSIQFSQEADLGAHATFDLQMERFTRSENVFRLAVTGLPREVRHEFRDPETGARVNQIRFPGGVTQRNLQLVLSLPQRASDSLLMDEPILFWVLALEESVSGDRIRSIEEGGDPATDVTTGKSRLELVPRGVGRIQVRATNLYHEIRPADRLAVDVIVRNSGTRTLEHVRLRLEAPSRWEVDVEPEFLPALPVNAEQRVRVSVRPPPDVVRGEYEVRLRTESAAADRQVEVEDRTIRIRVAAAGSWITTGAASLLLVGFAGGVVLVGYRLARR